MDKNTSKKSGVMYNSWRNNHKVSQIRKRYTPRRFNICLHITFGVISCVCSDKLRKFEHVLYPAYANDTTFFVKKQTSVIEILKLFDKFSNISGLKPNTKCEIAGIGVLKGVTVVLCSMKCINLNEQSVKFWVYTFLIIKNLKKKKTLIFILLRSNMF